MLASVIAPPRVSSDARSGEPPFGPAVCEPARGPAFGAQPPDRVVGVGAERAAAVGHDFGVGWELGEPALEFVERDRACPLDVPGGVLLLGADVDEYDVAARQPCQQVL